MKQYQYHCFSLDERLGEEGMTVLNLEVSVQIDRKFMIAGAILIVPSRQCLCQPGSNRKRSLSTSLIGRQIESMYS
jgi:hypothetical protein